MKPTLILLFALPVVAACAAQGDQYAQTDCRIVPITTASATGKYSTMSPLDNRMAELQLGASDFRRRELRRNVSPNNIEDSLRDCANRP